MANKAHRKTDANIAGAPIITVAQSPSVFTNDLEQSVDGSMVAPHGLPPHAIVTTLNGSTDVFVENIPANFEGNDDTCGHVRVDGSPNVFIDAVNTGIAGIVDNSVVVIDPFIRSDVTEFVSTISFIEEPIEDDGTTLMPSPSNPAVLIPVSSPAFSPPPLVPPVGEVPVIPPLVEIPLDCSDIFEKPTNYNFPGSFVLSPNFNLALLSTHATLSHYNVRPQVGLTTNQIVCNLRMLSLNVLEPLKVLYPNMFVTSGFRHGSGSSQHNKGQAADVQLSGTNYQQQWDAAKVVAESLTYDQFILELGNNYWFHLSYSNGANRQAVLTRIRPGNYQPNLIRIV